MNKQPSQAQIQQDIKKNKIKEGMLVKQSRHLKQWKQRWMVLTRTHLYSFSQKGVYKNPTELIQLQKTLTVKSYYKMQYQKPHIFRVQTPQIHMYLSPKNHEEKWAWMTAIQKMLSRVFTPQQKPDTSAMIRQTLKMSSAMRQTLGNPGPESNNILGNNTKQQSTLKQPIKKEQNIKDVLEKLKLNIAKNTVSVRIQSPQKSSSSPEIKIANRSSLSANLNPIKLQEPAKIQRVEIQKEKIVQREKIVEVEKQKVVEKLVYVPQIRQKIVEKIVYVDSNSESNKNYLLQIFKDIMAAKIQNPRPMVDFIVFLITSRLEKYHPTVISFLMSSQIQRFFSQIFLIMLNQETDQSQLNTYLQFVSILYENCEEYFYASDVKVLVDIVLREMELNRSQFNQYLLMNFIKTLASKQWWKKENHRKDQLKMMVKELESISGPQNQMLAGQLLTAL